MSLETERDMAETHIRTAEQLFNSAADLISIAETTPQKYVNGREIHQVILEKLGEVVNNLNYAEEFGASKQKIEELRNEAYKKYNEINTKSNEKNQL